mmetsp:Transcript_23261/g.79413  ORF Transcript_23261/g.79413 Transcript_23261/m.79413 type:complete len:206 (+) Transcript_23261:275-892(+)
MRFAEFGGDERRDLPNLVRAQTLAADLKRAAGAAAPRLGEVPGGIVDEEELVWLEIQVAHERRDEFGLDKLGASQRGRVLAVDAVRVEEGAEAHGLELRHDCALEADGDDVDRDAAPPQQSQHLLQRGDARHAAKVRHHLVRRHRVEEEGFVGDGPLPEALEELWRRQRRVEVEDDAAQPSSAVVLVFGALDAAVLPRRREGFGL